MLPGWLHLEVDRIKLLVSALMLFIMRLFLLFRSDNGLMKYISSLQGMND